MENISLSWTSEYTLYRGKKTRDYKQITLGQAFSKFVSEREISCSPSTIARYEEYQEIYFRDILDIRLCDIDNELLQDKVNQLSTCYAPKTVKNAYNHLHSVLEEFLTDHFWKVHLPPEEPSEFYIPITAEVEELIAEADNKILVPILLAAYGGLRRSEVCGLKKSDFTEKGVHIRRAVVYDRHKKPCVKLPKTKAGYRFVPLPGSVIYMATHWNGFGILPNSLTRSFERTVKRLDGVPYFSYHKLRHYYASKLHAEGVPDQYICKVGGWKSPQTVQKIYQHTLRDVEKEMNTKIASIFSTNSTKSC